jgi:hypothetical protein
VSRQSQTTQSSELEWKFKDDLGRFWIGYVSAAPFRNEKDNFELTLRLTRQKK